MTNTQKAPSERDRLCSTVASPHAHQQPSSGSWCWPSNRCSAIETAPAEQQPQPKKQHSSTSYEALNGMYRQAGVGFASNLLRCRPSPRVRMQGAEHQPCAGKQGQIQVQRQLQPPEQMDLFDGIAQTYHEDVLPAFELLLELVRAVARLLSLLLRYLALPLLRGATGMLQLTFRTVSAETPRMTRLLARTAAKLFPHGLRKRHLQQQQQEEQSQEHEQRQEQQQRPQQEQQQQKQDVNCQSDPVPPPPYFFCPITLDVMREPVVADDGYTYEASAITAWMRSQPRSTPPRSPMTNEPMQSASLLPNRALRSSIKEWQQQPQRRSSGSSCNAGGC